MGDLATSETELDPEPEVPMIVHEGPLGKTIVGPEPGAFLRWEAERNA